MVRALDKKLFRDLLGLKGQAITIALVVACGIAGYVSMQSTCFSLERAGDRFYEETRFADVFVHLKRAPNSLSASSAAWSPNRKTIPTKSSWRGRVKSRGESPR